MKIEKGKYDLLMNQIYKNSKKIRLSSLPLDDEGRGDLFEIKKKEKRLIIPSNLRSDR